MKGLMQHMLLAIVHGNIVGILLATKNILFISNFQ